MRATAVLLLALAANPALAGSIDRVKSLPKGSETESLMRVTCPACAAAPSTVNRKAADVVTLKPGEQKVELKTINGEEKLVRTEAWLGGSPVVFISKATPEMIAAYFPGRTPSDGIDESSKTAALPDGAKAAAPAALDLSGFSLRTP